METNTMGTHATITRTGSEPTTHGRFVPSNEELLAVARYWQQRDVDYYYSGFLTGVYDSWRVPVRATDRINEIAKVVGEKRVDETCREAFVEYVERQDKTFWGMFMRGEHPPCDIEGLPLRTADHALHESQWNHVAALAWLCYTLHGRGALVATGSDRLAYMPADQFYRHPQLNARVRYLELYDPENEVLVLSEGRAWHMYVSRVDADNRVRPKEAYCLALMNGDHLECEPLTLEMLAEQGLASADPTKVLMPPYGWESPD